MSLEAPPTDGEALASGIWRELKSAGMHSVAWLALILFAAYMCFVIFSATSYQELGQIGDSFGVLTALFNALAFAALIATVVLQSRELRESRVELAKQAKAQEAWANAAAKQIELTKQLEAIRIRPFIKLEWHLTGSAANQIDLRVRNVGLGVAVLDSFELWARGQAFGTVAMHGTPETSDAWTRCILHALNSAPGRFDILMFQFDDLNRALAPSEMQAIISVRVRGGDDRERVAYKLRSHFKPVIYFHSAAGTKLSTVNQFADEVHG